MIVSLHFLSLQQWNYGIPSVFALVVDSQFLFDFVNPSLALVSSMHTHIRALAAHLRLPRIISWKK